jgi:protein gp37
MKGTAINWCDSTFNCWEGCTKVSPGCTNCYAKARDDRQLVEPVRHWGPGAPRRIMSDSYWKQPLAWDREAANAGTRPRVFCGSLCDWADDEAPAGQRDRLWDLIRHTPHLDWLLLTKRANNIKKYLPADWRTGYPNVWLGVTVENQQHGNPRLDVLREIPTVVRFASCEPLLEDLGAIDLNGINWVIIGGETGPNARSMDTAWAKSIIEQCRAQGVAPWMKQLGKLPTENGATLTVPDANGNNADNMDRWPDTLAALKVRELPNVDSGVIATGVNEAELRRIETELGQLAEELDSEEAAKELELREQFIGAERRLFMTRLERSKILAGFKALYGPIRKWSEFCRIIDLPRRTAYNLLNTADEAKAETPDTANCAKSAQSSRKESSEPFKYGFDTAVDKAVASLNRIFKTFTETQRQQALAAVMDRLGAGARPIHITEKLIEAQPDSYRITSSVPVASEKSTEVAA